MKMLLIKNIIGGKQMFKILKDIQPEFLALLTAISIGTSLVFLGVLEYAGIGPALITLGSFITIWTLAWLMVNA